MPGIAFGPVPSRRLGKSLGVNNVFYKFCTYSCVYCQLGRTTHLTVERRRFYDPDEVLRDVCGVLEDKEADFITFVPDGEPTLDVNLGIEAKMIKSECGKPIAIISNSSLIFREDVREDLMPFDLVSLKIDAVDKTKWKEINRPHPTLDLELILRGIRDFSREYGGGLIGETMLVSGLNDSVRDARELADFLSDVELDALYLSVPIRPPAESWVEAPDYERIIPFYETLSDSGIRVELLIHPEPPEFQFGDDLLDEISRTIVVHPIRVSYLEKIAREKNRDPKEVLRTLLEKGAAKIVRFGGEDFLVSPMRR